MRLIREMLGHIEAQRTQQLQSVESMQRETSDALVRRLPGTVTPRYRNLISISISFISSSRDFSLYTMTCLNFFSFSSPSLLSLCFTYNTGWRLR